MGQSRRRARSGGDEILRNRNNLAISQIWDLEGGGRRIPLIFGAIVWKERNHDRHTQEDRHCRGCGVAVRRRRRRRSHRLRAPGDSDGECRRLKEDVRASRNRAAQSVNSELVCLYWRIGNVLKEHAEYGNRFIESLAKDLRAEFPGIKGMSARNLRFMARFAREVDFEILQIVSAKLSWSHNVKLLESLKGMERQLWYVREAISQGWSLAVLGHQIDTQLSCALLSRGAIATRHC